MRICKFTHDRSLLCGETRFWIVGPSASPADWYDFTSYTDGTIADAVNLDEGMVHLLMSHGSVFEIKSNPETAFIIQMLRSA